MRCGRCQALLGFDGHSLRFEGQEPMDSCAACWPDLLDALADEGLDVRPFANVKHLVLVPDAPTPLAPRFSVN